MSVCAQINTFTQYAREASPNKYCYTAADGRVFAKITPKALGTKNELLYPLTMKAIERKQFRPSASKRVSAYHATSCARLLARVPVVSKRRLCSPKPIISSRLSNKSINVLLRSMPSMR